MSGLIERFVRWVRPQDDEPTPTVRERLDEYNPMGVTIPSPLSNNLVDSIHDDAVNRPLVLRPASESVSITRSMATRRAKLAVEKTWGRQPHAKTLPAAGTPSSDPHCPGVLVLAGVPLEPETVETYEVAVAWAESMDAHLVGYTPSLAGASSTRFEEIQEAAAEVASDSLSVIAHTVTDGTPTEVGGRVAGDLCTRDVWVSSGWHQGVFDGLRFEPWDPTSEELRHIIGEPETPGTIEGGLARADGAGAMNAVTTMNNHGGGIDGEQAVVSNEVTSLGRAGDQYYSDVARTQDFVRRLQRCLDDTGGKR